MKHQPRLADLTRKGLWDNNPGVVQLLGLCPLAAVSISATYGVALGVATLFTLLISNGLISAIRRWIPDHLRLVAYVLAISTTVSVIDLTMSAYYPVLYQRLGLFIPLIATNCVILARAEVLASKASITRALVDAASMGTGFMLVLGALGGLRELVAHGVLFSQAELLVGESGRFLEIALLPAASPFLLAVLPPGAFLGLALLIALQRSLARAPKTALAASRPSPTSA